MAVITFTPLYGVKSRDQCCAYLLEIDDVCILLDCGWTDEFNTETLKPLQKVVERIDLVLISHPDMAHIGALPYAISQFGLSSPVYGTLPVHRLGQITLYDAYQAITRSNSEFDLFNLDHVDAVFENFKQLKYSEKLTLTSSGEGIVITPHAAGHLIGGSIWNIMKDTDEIIYAVDYNHRSEHVLPKSVLSSFVRPTLLITDSMSFYTKQPKLKDRDSTIMVHILKTLRSGGDVLLPTDSSGRVLELMRVLDQYWLQNKLRDPVALLHDMSYYTPKAAQAMLEWCNEQIAKNFDAGRQNPFQFSNIHLIHSLEELDSLPSPKVVLATSASLQCGYAKHLFIEYASNPRNAIIFTTTPPHASLGAQVLGLMDEGEDRVISCSVSKKVYLEGAELAIFEAKERRRLRAEAENKAKELEEAAMEDMMMGIEDYESDTEERDNAQPRGNFKVGLGQFAAVRYPMFFFTEKKAEWDEYGETIQPEEFRDKSLAASYVSRQGIMGSEYTDNDVDMTESSPLIDTRPMKTVVEELQITIHAKILWVDFDGIADGRAIRNCLSNVKPRKLILVHGTKESSADLKRFVETTISLCEAIFVPNSMECIDIESNTNVYKLAIQESLYTSMLFHKVGNHDVTFVQGRLFLNEDSSVPILEAIDRHESNKREPLLLSDGKLKLDVMKQVLGKAGFNAKFRGGMLVCNDGVVLKRSFNNEIVLEGALSASYFRIRALLYEQFTLV